MRAPSFCKSFYLTVIAVMVLFTASAQLKADFTGTPLSGCAPLVVRFTDASTGNPVSWKWDLGNVTTAMTQNPSSTYFNSGTYNVTLTITDASGATSTITKSQYITVFAQPNVDFSGSPLTGCFPLKVDFKDATTVGGVGGSPLTKWLWDFGDGNGDSIPNPTHIYTSAGNSNVTLRVTNENGCSKVVFKENYINVAPGVKADFTNDIPSNCSAPQTINFQNLSSGAGTLNYVWDFGDGTSSVLVNPSHTYTNPGSYTVTLTVSNNSGCVDKLVKPNAITIGMVKADFTAPATTCEGATVPITNTSMPMPSSVQWNFGDGTNSTSFNPNKIYNTAGTYNITLVSNFGACQDTKTQQITVLAKPTSSFTGTPLTSCKPPLTVNFTNNSIGATSTRYIFGDGTELVTLGNGNASHTYTTQGRFTIQMITTNADGCTDVATIVDYVKIVSPTVTINELPIQGCAPLTYTFSSTVNSVEPVIKYEWFFGDGTSSTQQNPTHTFPAGSYDIKLEITTSGGCTVSTTVNGGVQAAAPPIPDFSADPRDVCAEVPVVFKDLSTGTISNTKYLWDFGDGATSTQQNPMHIYEDTGFFDVKLIVINNGCSTIVSKPRYIFVKAPIALFRIIPNCLTKFTRIFKDSSIGPVDTWLWDFGDGSTSTLQNPTHTYMTVGQYNVSLTVTNIANNCKFTTTQSTNITDEDAIFTATLTELCKNSATTFNATSKQVVNQIIAYEWDFGDGTSTTGNNPTHIYTKAGLYTVTLTVTDANNCKSTDVKPNYIKVNGPTSNFRSTVPGSCLMTDVTFDDLSTSDGEHPITMWYFNYGDGTLDTLTGPPFKHAYLTAGTYDVGLVVKDSYGCTDSFGLKSSIVISSPLASFSSANVKSCPSKNIVFNNASTGPGLTYLWDFGDGNTSTAAQPTHTYAADGTYDVKLSIVDMYGCKDDTLMPAYINITTPVADFTADKTTSTCPPLITEFVNTSTNQESFSWDFGDGNSSTLASPTHFYNSAGTYTAVLTVIGFGGCISTKSQEIIVRGPKGTFAYTNFTGCKTLTVDFTANTLDNVTFTWDFNDGNTETTTVPFTKHDYALPGTYFPKLILRDNQGCSVPILGEQVITVNGVTSDFTADTLQRCDSGRVVLTNKSISNDVITGYVWDFGDGATSTQENPSHFYAGTGNYVVKLTTNTQAGCTDTKTMSTPIKVIKTPEAGITQSPNGCVPLDMNFNGTLQNADTSAVNWQWSFSDGRKTTGQIIPSFIFRNPGIYQDTVIATNSSGCIDTAFTSLEAFAIPVIDAGQDIEICEKTGETISATGGNTYAWSPAAGLSCTNCQTPTANPASNTTYKVIGTSAQGCPNEDSVKVVVNMPFKMAFSPEDTICVGQSAILNASGAATYQWSPATGLNKVTGPSVTASPSTTIQYRVVGFDGKNCFTDTALFPIKVYPFPTVKASEDKTINIGKSVELTAKVSADATKIVWTPSLGIISTNLPSITVQPNLQTEYKVSVTNIGGCTTTDVVNVFVICDGNNIFIPNTFSPNADGANDIFYPRGTGLFTIKQLRIFNRWGEEVFARYSFKANDANAGWDGNLKAQKLPGDVYVYYCEIQCENNATLVYKGNITLVR